MTSYFDTIVSTEADGLGMTTRALAHSLESWGWNVMGRLDPRVFFWGNHRVAYAEDVYDQPRLLPEDLERRILDRALDLCRQRSQGLDASLPLEDEEALRAELTDSMNITHSRW